MAQQPNIELDISDLPRPVAHPAPARRWRPARPGDLAGPAEVPSGAGFGATGPDGGYALRLVSNLELVTADGESLHTAQSAVAALAVARAAGYGRAPTPDDVEIGALILGYLPIDESPDAELAALRRPLVKLIGHSASRGRELASAVEADVLAESASEIRARLAAGERLFT